MYTFERERNVSEPVPKVWFRIAADRQSSARQEQNAFLASVIRRVADLIPSHGVLPEEYAEYVFQAAEEIQAGEGNIGDELYRSIGKEALTLCYRAANGDEGPGADPSAGIEFCTRVEQSVAYQLAFTPYAEQREQRL